MTLKAMAETSKTTITNREVFRDFYLDKTYEAGIQLRGDEVKSVRGGKANLKGSFARVDGTEVFVFGMHISPYKFAREEQDPVRPRKLLLNKTEIKQIGIKVTREGYTLVPTKVYFRRGYAKIEIALAKGKKLHDKRAALKEKQANREIHKALREKNR
jgi:SsrA-binding protein